MATYWQVIFYSLIGGIFSLIGCILLFLRTKQNVSILKLATPFAAGALLSAVFLDLLAEGVEQSPPSTVFLSTLIGIIVFFLGERFLGWFHHNHGDADADRHSSVFLIIVGNAMHNAIDGVAIAAAFLVNVPTGIVTTFAVAAHEVPHNAADFGLLVNKKLSRQKALLITTVSNFTTVIIAVLMFGLGANQKLPVGFLLGISSGFLLYIALSDIIPDIHSQATNKKAIDIQAVMLIAGAVVVGLAIWGAHHLVPHSS